METIAFALLALTAAAPAEAHDPGLSRIELTAAGHSLDAHMVYARRDAEWIVPMDGNGDGVTDDREWMAARDRLSAFGRASMSLSLDTKPLAPTSSVVTRDDSDGIHFRLKFPAVDGGTLVVASEVPARLALGHRQFVTLKDGRGKVHTGMLSATQARLTLSFDGPDLRSQFMGYFRGGIHHIWIGYDHILFLVALLLSSPLCAVNGRWIRRETFSSGLSEVVRIVTAFTLAHSLTLAASVLGFVVLSPDFVEPAIAASVAVAAMANFFPALDRLRWPMGFLFGLIHGMGFGGVLFELGLPPASRGISLLAFNLGVEVGQIVIVVMTLPLLFAISKPNGFGRGVLGAGSLAIALVAFVWLIERSARIELIAVF